MKWKPSSNEVQCDKMQRGDAASRFIVDGYVSVRPGRTPLHIAGVVAFTAGA
jgi:hypothetical protein